MKKIFFVVFGLLSQMMCAQQANEWILKINDSIYYQQDFERLYNKNIDLVVDDNQKDVSSYVDLYVLYKLKLQDAYRKGVQNEESFLLEFMEQRKSLAEKYFINEDELNGLVEEALERDQWEVRAFHLLLKVAPAASSKDTLEVYHRAMTIRDKIVQGTMSFEEAAKSFSEDPSAEKNGGDLGYFSVFRMVYPFESGAYQTKVGEVSMPVRSDFGYHLIYVVDKRKKEALREVSQIYIDKNIEGEQAAKEKIKSIYASLKQGADFEELALSNNSEERERETRGYIGVFNQHTVFAPKYGDVVYALEEGGFTQVLEEEGGYRIFKLNRIRPEASVDEKRFLFLRRVKNDMRSKILDKHLSDYLSKEYRLELNQPIYDAMVQNFSEELYQKEELHIEGVDEQAWLMRFDNNKRSLSVRDFLNWLGKNRNRFVRIEDIHSVVVVAFDVYKSIELKGYYDQHLEERYPEFRLTLQEFKNGLLLFDLMQNHVWGVAQRDEETLLAYYNKNKASWRKDGKQQSFEDVKSIVKSRYAEQYQTEYEQNLLKNACIEVNRPVIESLKKKYPTK